MIKQVSITLASLLLCAGLAQAASHAGAAPMNADCVKQAAEKKLYGAAKNSFIKKCSGDAAAASPASEACARQAAEKKLYGAAKNSFVKKCAADAK